MMGCFKWAEPIRPIQLPPSIPLGWLAYTATHGNGRRTKRTTTSRLVVLRTRPIDERSPPPRTRRRRRRLLLLLLLLLPPFHRRASSPPRSAAAAAAARRLVSDSQGAPRSRLPPPRSPPGTSHTRSLVLRYGSDAASS
ncbi:hypothetical protein DAI22_02g206001 [Oryza sativa Japonica Group]|nr:hypothetical protein DAI22_02g206001 [Oryza sativa Japonica Group]